MLTMLYQLQARQSPKIPMRSDPYHVTTEIDKWEKAGEEEHGNFNVRISMSLSVC